LKLHKKYSFWRSNQLLSKNIYLLLLSGIYFLFSGFTLNQPENIIKKYSVEDGLSLGIVTSITQDKRGLMWFATEDGLNRFDGYKFKTFKYNPENKSSLAGNFVRKVFTDSKGVIWVSSRRGLNRFEPQKEQFTHYRHQPEISSSIAGDDISDITESASGNLWIASYNAGFSYFHRNKNTFSAYNKQVLPALASHKIICLYEDTKGWLWIGSQDAGIQVFKVANGVVQEKVTLPLINDLPAASIKCIYEDNLSNIWVGTTNGLYRYNRANNKFFLFKGQQYFNNSNIILSLLEDQKEMLWVGVQDGGVYKLDLRQLKHRNPEAVAFTEVKSQDNIRLTQRSVQALYKDKNQNIWVGTVGNGIAMVSSEKEKFINFRMYDRQRKLHLNNDIRFYGTCTDKEGNFWLGTDGNGLYRCRPNGEILNHYDKSTDNGLTDNAILCALQDSRDNLWFGSYSEGLFLYQKETDSFLNFKHDPKNPQSLGRNDVRILFEKTKKNIWIGTNGGGLSQFNPVTKTFKNYNTRNSKISSNDVRAIAEEEKGKLWLGTYGGGILEFLPEKQFFKAVTLKKGNKNLIRSQTVLSLFLDKHQNLWIGTEEDGLLKYNIPAKKVWPFNDNNGLINNTIYAIQPDYFGNIWVSTNKGLSKIAEKTLAIFNYDAADGLQSGQFNATSLIINAKEGIMGFGGTRGFNLFYPGQLTEKLSAPKAFINNLQLYGKPGNTGQVEQHVIENANITLQPDQSVFTLEFGALDFVEPENINYAYKLAGLDQDWNYVGKQRTATYRYLEPGSYTFMVKASNQDASWPTNFTSIQITVLPPLWRTPLAYIIYIFCSAFLVYGLVLLYNRQKKLRRRLTLAKAQSRKQRRIARERLSFFTEVSHEFRTPLTLILSPLDDLLSKEANTETGKKLKLVHKNAQKLLNLINQLLDYRKVEAGSMVLKAKEADIVAFLQEIYLSFGHLADKNHINYSLKTPETPVLVYFEKEKLEMVITNLLANAFKYIGKGNKIEVSLQTEAEFVRIEVKDNGIGIPVSQQKHIFDWFYQGDPVTSMSSGLGLALAKKLVQLHKGEIFVQSKEGVGSVFGFKIPLGTAHLNPAEICTDETPAILAEDALPVLVEEELTTLNPNSSKKGLKKILIVEDEADIRKFLKYYLEEKFHIIEAANGQEGLDLALAQHPDIIISDVKMPVMDGIALCNQLKANIQTSHIPVVLLTARTALTHQKEGLETGADAYLTKPFSPELLKLKIDNLLKSQEQLKKFYLNLFNLNNPQAEKEVKTVDEKFLKRIYEILKANLDNPEFNVNELAAALNMSRSLAYKKIKMLTGVSPVEYLRSLRIQESAKLLKTGKFKVFEVGYQVGFNDDKYFRQCFLKEFGCNPSEFIKQSKVVS